MIKLRMMKGQSVKASLLGSSRRVRLNADESRGATRGQSCLKKLFTVHCSLFTELGFTLIETIMVMVIAVILAAVVAVRWSPFDTIKLNSATRKVAGDIRYAQKVAISTQAMAAISFAGTSYGVYQNFASAIFAPSPGDPCSDSGGNFQVDFNADRCSNYSNVTVSPITLFFNSLGTPVNTFGSIINAEQTVTVTYKGTQPITVWRDTGRVSYQ
jgi:prepilin-type N-terminal cleavage/methylation domain-containing protein